MAITLAEAKVGMADKVDQQIVDMFRRSSLLLDNMVFDNVISPGTGGSTLTYGYIQLKSPSTASTRTVGGEYTPGEAKKEKKTEKVGFFARVGKWLKEMKSELKKVSYPSSKQVINNTLIVLLCVLVVGIFVWLFDGIATFVVQGLISLVKGG